MRRSLFLLTLVLSASLLPVPALAGDRVIARVGSEPVTRREVQLVLAQDSGLSRKEALDLLIERRLVLDWAARNGVTVSDEEIGQAMASIRERNNLTPEQFERALADRGESLEFFRETLREQLTVNKALGRALASRVQVSEDELREAYSKEFPSRKTLEVSHILLALDREADPREDARVREAAREVLERLREGASFEDMVREYSQDPSSSQKGGSLGTFREGELIPELEEAVSPLEPGEVAGPVQTPAGYHILRLDSRGTTDPPPLAQVRDQLERELMAEKEALVRSRWLDELRDEAYVEIFPDGS